MSEQVDSVPPPASVRPEFLPPEVREIAFFDPNEHAARARVRFLVIKLIGSRWVPMARVSTDDRLQELCSALGGLVRVYDYTENRYVIDEEYH